MLSTNGCKDAAKPGAAVEQEALPPEVPRPQGDERLILAFGDSLYASYGLDKRQGLPAQLQDALRRSGINATVVDAGVSGDTTAGGRQRLGFALDSLPRSPDLVILGLGGNDALRQVAPSETRANLDAMLDELDGRKVKVLLTGMRAPRNIGPDYAKSFEPIWPDLAREHRAALYPFILEGVVNDPALMQKDGIHPTAKGIGIMVSNIAPLAATALPADRGQ